MNKIFSIKNKFFAIILAFCFLIPTLLSGCSFFGDTDNGDTPPAESTPTLTIVTDSQLVYSEANSRYEITIAQGESYTLNVNLGDYTGDEYSIVYSWNSSGNNYASIENIKCKKKVEEELRQKRSEIGNSYHLKWNNIL